MLAGRRPATCASAWSKHAWTQFADGNFVTPPPFQWGLGHIVERAQLLRDTEGRGVGQFIHGRQFWLAILVAGKPPGRFKFCRHATLRPSVRVLQLWLGVR